MNIGVMLGVANMPPIFDFKQNNEYFLTEVNNPYLINSIYFAITKPLNNNDTAVALYYSPYPYNNIEYLAAIANERPSTIIPTGFTLNQSWRNIQSVMLLIKFDQIANLKNLIDSVDVNSFQYNAAKQIALNMYNFFCSIDCQNIIDNNGNKCILIPQIAFDKWLEKFEKKLWLDPFFLERINLENNV